MTGSHLYCLGFKRNHQKCNFQYIVIFLITEILKLADFTKDTESFDYSSNKKNQFIKYKKLFYSQKKKVFWQVADVIFMHYSSWGYCKIFSSSQASNTLGLELLHIQSSDFAQRSCTLKQILIKQILILWNQAIFSSDLRLWELSLGANGKEWF